MNKVLYKELSGKMAVRNNPKRFEKEVSLLSVGNYYRETEVDTTREIVMEKEGIVISNAEYNTNSYVEIRDLDKISKISRISKGYLAVFDAVTATIVNDEILTININCREFKVVYFPVEGSNVGIYTNNLNISSYVVDGRAILSEETAEIKVVSTNELAMREWFRKEATKKDGEKSKSFDKILSEELWQIKEDSEEDEEVVKALMWLNYTRYMNFPKFNICWLVKLEDGKFIEDKWTNHKEILDKLEQKMRISSISQNGIVATIGNIDDKGLVQSDVKPFFGVKGKFDISATNGIKSFKTYKKSPKKVLIVIAEINFGNGPINALGNNLVTKEAYDEYVTLRTKEASDELNVAYPAHKTFIKVQGEPVRVKGATSFIEATAVFEDGTTEEKVLILPPSEYNINGQLEEDLDKFKFVLAYRDNPSKNKLKNIILEVTEGSTVVKINTVGFYADVYEDANHSALSSGLKIKHQNIFYYGAFAELYRHNSVEKIREAIADRIDQELLTSVYSFLGMNVK